MEGGFLGDDAAALSFLGGFDVTGAKVDALHHDAVLVRQSAKHLAGLAPVLAGDHLDGVALADAHLDALDGPGLGGGGGHLRSPPERGTRSW